MRLRIEEAILRFSMRREPKVAPPPLLVELFRAPTPGQSPSYEKYPFAYGVSKTDALSHYEVWNLLGPTEIEAVRESAWLAANDLDPSEVEPLTFERLVEVLKLLSAERLAGRVKEVARLSELSAYDAIGMSRILALGLDDQLTEVFVDSDSSPAYVDHAKAGRCETSILLTGRERSAIETHLDTFRGYTPDYTAPSLKNDLMVSGAKLRISLDIAPVAVNRFSLDIRRLNLNTLTLRELVRRNVISGEAASLLLGWLEAGGNVSIVGETGTGKTTLLNALDTELDPRLRRLYIEDAVETRELLDKGYHQVKVKVDPLDRGSSTRTKEFEIVKALHRSPDVLILSEIQSKEHSLAFFQSLAAGLRGLQTFHASTVEQAVRRWVSMHQIPPETMSDLGLLVQMSRPDRLLPERYVARICEFRTEGGSPRVRELYMRDRSNALRQVAASASPAPPPGVTQSKLESLVRKAGKRLAADPPVVH